MASREYFLRGKFMVPTDFESGLEGCQGMGYLPKAMWHSPPLVLSQATLLTLTGWNTNKQQALGMSQIFPWMEHAHRAKTGSPDPCDHGSPVHYDCGNSVTAQQGIRYS